MRKNTTKKQKNGYNTTKQAGATYHTQLLQAKHSYLNPTTTMTKQRGEFTATVTTRIYPSSPDEHRRGEVRRGNGPTIYISSRKKKDKTEQEMRDDLKTGREKSLRENSNIEKREQNARIADAQISYYEDRYGKDSRKRPTVLD